MALTFPKSRKKTVTRLSLGKVLDIWLTLPIPFDDDMLFRQLKNFRQLRTVSLVISNRKLPNAQTADLSPVVIEFPTKLNLSD